MSNSAFIPGRLEDVPAQNGCHCGSGGCAGGLDIFTNNNAVTLTISAHADGLSPAHPGVQRKVRLDRRGFTRRSFLRTATVAVGGLAATTAALSPIIKAGKEAFPSLSELLQKHYKEMSPADKEKVFTRIQDEIRSRHGVDVKLQDPPPLDGVEFVYALNLSRCNGNRACVHACMQENNQSRAPEIQYIRVLEMPRGTLDVEHSNHYFDDATVPAEGMFYMPVQCHQCANAPCVKVCPIEATWTEPDGITVVDYDWCIGCRYCEAACPYWARRFNFSEPVIPVDQINPEMSYLSNRIRQNGVIEKCTYCLHRTRLGRMPACLEACPTGARKFGNIKDSSSEVYQILKTKRIFILKEEVGTLPRFFYYFDERAPRSVSSQPTPKGPINLEHLPSAGEVEAGGEG